jgi:hypothetical protein
MKMDFKNQQKLRRLKNVEHWYGKYIGYISIFDNFILAARNAEGEDPLLIDKNDFNIKRGDFEIQPIAFSSDYVITSKPELGIFSMETGRFRKIVVANDNQLSFNKILVGVDKTFRIQITTIFTEEGKK